MTKPTIVTRAGKGAPLTTTEGDSNFTNLRDATIGVLANGTTVTTDLNGSFEIEAGSGILVVGNNSTKKITISNTGTSGITQLSDDTAPMLGGNLSVGSYSIVSPANSNLKLTPAGTGKVRISNAYNLPSADGTSNQVLKTDGSGNISFASVLGLLPFTPEDNSLKNQANGYAGLDSSGKISSSLLPSYVDDVVEANDYASLPGTGEAGKIYVTKDTNKTYRWSGSGYVEISASPGSTDAVSEGSTNLYFTNGRARSAISVSGSLSYNSSTGVISYSTPSTDGVSEGSSNLYFTDARARGAISGTGVISYNSSTGVFSFNSPVIPSQTGNSGKYLTTDGTSVSWATVAGGMASLFDDTAPTLSADLDVNGHNIKTTASNGSIVLAPNGTGSVKIGNGSALGYITSNGAYNLKLDTNGGTNSGMILINQGANGNIGITPNGTGKIMLNGALGISSTTGTPSTYNTSYFEGTLDTPASWLKVNISGSDYYLPMFQ
jgi:hypothetical protein